MGTHTLAAVLACLLPLAAQDPPTPPPELPAAGSPAATELLDRGIAKMLALGRGMFRTSARHRLPVPRGARVATGTEIVVEGGWQQGFVWGDVDGECFARHGGRMVAKQGEVWKLRADRLGSGRQLPFVLDPELLFTVLQELPAEARRVVHVEAGQVAGRKVAILTLALAEEVAADFADAGTLPSGEMALGSEVLLLRRVNAARAGKAERSVYLAVYVDVENGDVPRLTAKVYDSGSSLFRGVFPNGQPAAEPEPAAEEPEWREGLPTRKPEQSEAVTTYRVDFTRRGLAELPELPARTKQLLRLR